MSNFLVISLILLVSLAKCSTDPSESTIKANDICSKKGIYNEDNKECYCLPGNVTFPKNSEAQCNYELRSSQVALVISAFFGLIGADMFYLGFVMKGLFKCIFPLGVFFVVLKIQNNKLIEQYQMSSYIIFLPLILTFLLWIFDIFAISAGWINDSNGLPLI